MQVSTSAPDSAFEEIAEMSRKLERSEKDFDLMNKQVEQSQCKRPTRRAFFLKVDFEPGLMPNLFDNSGVGRA
jgi:hypothetical protein